MKEEWRGISPPQVGPGSTGPVPYNVLYTPSLAEQISSMANASCICLVTSFTPFIRVASPRLRDRGQAPVTSRRNMAVGAPERPQEPCKQLAPHRDPIAHSQALRT